MKQILITWKPSINRKISCCGNWMNTTLSSGRKRLKSQDKIRIDRYGGEIDLKEAFKWYRLSAYKRGKYGMYNLGRMYENGYGVKKDYREAYKWYKWANRYNHPKGREAMKKLLEKIRKKGKTM